MLCLFSRRILPLAAALTLLACIISARVLAGDHLPENPGEVSWHISALMVTYDNKRDLYIAEDEVVITGGKTRLEADYLEFSNKTKDAFAQGNVLLISGQDSITCNSMQINLLTEKGVINKGTIFIQENNFYIHGENIKKTGEFTFSMDKGSITSCEGDVPDWKITGKNVRVTVGGYGYASHTTLWAKEVPALYSPFLSFPVKIKRQTGLLTPRVSSSDRKGYEYEQPLFIAISRNMDTSLYVDYMTDRGVKTGGEFRYIMDNNSKGSMFLDLLHDDKIDDGTEKTEDYSYETTPQRTNKDRYWFRMKHDQNLPNDFTARLDLDIVSDADYLLEFKDGFTGYDETNRYFEENFGRSLDEYDDTTRKNSLNIYKSWFNYNFNVQALWYDDVIARRDNTEDTTLQTLPSIEFDAARQEIGKSNLFYTLNSEFRSFYRQDTTDTLVNGQRADVYPKLYLPLRLGRSFFFEPFIGTRGTAWYTDNFTDSSGNDKGFRTRATYDMGAQLSTKLNRIFTLNNSFADKVKHELVPKLEYTFQPNVIQDDLPYFDEIDRIEEKNQATWSLTNSFIARNPVVNPDDSKSTQYREFLWFKLYQDYNIAIDRDNSEEKPWSDIKLESEFYPFQYFSMDADLDWSPYTTHFRKIQVGASIRDIRGDSIYTSYRYTTESSETWYTRLNVKLTDYLMAYCSFENDLKDKKTIENRVGITINKACWGMGIEFSESSGENKITFLISLNGIGELGN